MTTTYDTTRFDEGVARADLVPLWERMGQLITPAPSPGCLPAHWRWEVLRPLLLEAGEMISAEEAERRVLILENPALRGTSRLTTSLYGGVQLVLPHETAPAHRHSQSALRFVLEGSGGHTIVGQERVDMEPGDVVVTPPGAWHAHGNESDGPMIWFDALDIPMVQFFDASFIEHGDAAGPSGVEAPCAAPLRGSAGLRPMDAPRHVLASPLIRYPFADAWSVLAGMAAAGPPDPHVGYAVEYVNPDTGGPVLATLTASLRFFAAGTRTLPRRSTDATVFVVHRGRGRSVVGSSVVEWQPGDVFTVPSWTTVTHEPQEDAVVFAYSDRAAQEKLGLWREERIEAP